MPSSCTAKPSLNHHRHSNHTTPDPQKPTLCSGHDLPPSLSHHLHRLHQHLLRPGQCCSVVVQTVPAPLPAVWSLVRRFDSPHSYKHFIRSCRLLRGDGLTVGSLREVRVVSGLPAVTSRERLEILDDDLHVLSFRVVGGEHRLRNYRSVTTLHDDPAGAGTVVVESYVVDVPAGNTNDDTRLFVDTIVHCNLQSLSAAAAKKTPSADPSAL